MTQQTLQERWRRACAPLRAIRRQPTVSVPSIPASRWARDRAVERVPPGLELDRERGRLAGDRVAFLVDAAAFDRDVVRDRRLVRQLDRDRAGGRLEGRLVEPQRSSRIGGELQRRLLAGRSLLRLTVTSTPTRDEGECKQGDGRTGDRAFHNRTDTRGCENGT